MNYLYNFDHLKWILSLLDGLLRLILLVVLEEWLTQPHKQMLLHIKKSHQFRPSHHLSGPLLMFDNQLPKKLNCELSYLLTLFSESVKTDLYQVELLNLLGLAQMLHLETDQSFDDQFSDVFLRIMPSFAKYCLAKREDIVIN